MPEFSVPGLPEVLAERLRHVAEYVGASSLAEAIEVAVNAWESAEADAALSDAEIAEIRLAIEEGQGKPGIPAEEVFARLEARYRALQPT